MAKPEQSSISTLCDIPNDDWAIDRKCINRIRANLILNVKCNRLPGNFLRQYKDNEVDLVNDKHF